MERRRGRGTKHMMSIREDIESVEDLIPNEESQPVQIDQCLKLREIRETDQDVIYHSGVGIVWSTTTGT